MKAAVVIPARLQSTRLPEKPLIDIAGKSLIRRTYEQCVKAVDSSDIYIATDHKRIADHCRGFGAQVAMTSENCLTGTDRIAEFSQQVKADYYINVQGDEPLINPKDITDIREALNKYPGEILNGYAEIASEESFRSLTIPKVVFRPDGRLLYMSRAAIPGNKKGTFVAAYRQICVYAFPYTALQRFLEAGKKTALEELEDIEILRFLELGWEVRMIPLSADSIAVDTPEDVKRVVKALSR